MKKKIVTFKDISGTIKVGERIIVYCNQHPNSFYPSGPMLTTPVVWFRSLPISLGPQKSYILLEFETMNTRYVYESIEDHGEGGETCEPIPAPA